MTAIIASSRDPQSVIEPLTDPAGHGETASDAFDVVIPSLPGYGFSGKPAATGWGPNRIARAWAVLMERLGYPRYVAQGGDWGTAISAAMARRAPDGPLGIHVNFAQMVPPGMLGHIRNCHPAPADLPDAEKRAYEQIAFATYHRGYGVIQARIADDRLQPGRHARRPRGLAPWPADGSPSVAPGEQRCTSRTLPRDLRKSLSRSNHRAACSTWSS
jgi:pimeloyl-ACP methyl ester carboxylesterase